MVRSLRFVGLVSLLPLCLAGCGNTGEGLQKDAANDTQGAVGAIKKVQNVGQDAVTSAASAANNFGANVSAKTLTPLVMGAIVRDPILNNSKNRIDVKSNAKSVRLVGHVVDASMTARAEEDAQAVLKSRHAKQTIKDELKVTGGQ